MSKFDETHDYSILAEHLGLEVTGEDMVNALNKLDDKNLLLFDYDHDEFDYRSIEKVGIHCYTTRLDVQQDILAEKLKSYLFNLAYYESERNEQDVEDIREFVEQHAEESMCTSGKFYEKLAEIDDDYVFLTFLSRNIKSLWW